MRAPCRMRPCDITRCPARAYKRKVIDIAARILASSADRYGWISAGRLPAQRRMKRTFRQWLGLAGSGQAAWTAKSNKKTLIAGVGNGEFTPVIWSEWPNRGVELGVTLRSVGRFNIMGIGEKAADVAAHANQRRKPACTAMVLWPDMGRSQGV